MAEVNYINPGITSPSTSGPQFDIKLSPLNQLRYIHQNRQMAEKAFNNQMSLQNLNLMQEEQRTKEFLDNAGMRQRQNELTMAGMERANELARATHRGEMAMAEWRSGDDMIKAAQTKEALGQQFETRMLQVQDGMMASEQILNGMQNTYAISKQYSQEKDPEKKALLQGELVKQAQISIEYYQKHGMEEEAAELQQAVETGAIFDDDDIREYEALEEQVVTAKSKVIAARAAQAERAAAEYENTLAKSLERAKAQYEWLKPGDDLEAAAARIIQTEPEFRTKEQAVFFRKYMEVQIQKNIGEAMVSSYFSSGRERLAALMPEKYAERPPTVQEYMEWMGGSFADDFMVRFGFEPEAPGAPTRRTPEAPATGSVQNPTQTKSGVPTEQPVSPPLPDYETYGRQTIPDDVVSQDKFKATGSAYYGRMASGGWAYVDPNGKDYPLKSGEVYQVKTDDGVEERIFNGGDPNSMESWLPKPDWW